MPQQKTNPIPTMPDLSGKVILITGGTAGLGAASAIALARRNPARIYIAGRRANAAEAVVQQARHDASSLPTPPPTTDIQFLPCDLADLSSVRAAADTILTAESRLDILMANAGVAAVPSALTKDGYEVQLGTNHLGHALLIRKLLPLLAKTSTPDSPARIVCTTSDGYRGAVRGIPLEDLGKRKTTPPADDWLGVARWVRYAQSKLANVVYARELARRYPGVVSVSVSPGIVSTGMVAGMRTCDRVGTRLLALVSGGMVEPEEGAWNQIWAATVDVGQLTNGGMYTPVGVLCEGGNLSAQARDEGLGGRLWEWTEGELKGWL
ncbi:dehydrogenase with different specificitie [Bombardia bombarda]|uniref:Dehydrogenase with different specificitie n=1 Tax=Bombardia bombarda TaxID=252184 RepID=A0AA39X1A4_9PEZI|nr:dehydrogenase with different specificitie [Bombardia bombarda]